MLVTLAFGYPFNGRVYANGNYQSCFEMGNGQNQMVMRIPLVGPCGTVQAVINCGSCWTSSTRFVFCPPPLNMEDGTEDGSGRLLTLGMRKQMARLVRTRERC